MKKNSPLIISNKKDLSNGNKVPLGMGRFIVVDGTRELYYDNDEMKRFKIRDIQIIQSLDSFITEDLSPLPKDFFYSIAENMMYFYDGSKLVPITPVTKYATVLTNDTECILMNNSYCYVITHNLGTKDIFVSAYLEETGQEMLFNSIIRASDNDIQLFFDTKINLNTRVVVRT